VWLSLLSPPIEHGRSSSRTQRNTTWPLKHRENVAPARALERLPGLHAQPAKVLDNAYNAKDQETLADRTVGPRLLVHHAHAETRPKMKTTEAEENNSICPLCGDRLATDNKGRGFVRHLTNADCQYGNGEKDVAERAAAAAVTIAGHNPATQPNR
jgi:hypothetical protein